MAKYILLNRIPHEGVELKAAKEIDDALFNIAKLQAEGAVLALLPNAMVEARAIEVRQQQARGRRESELDELTAAFSENASSGGGTMTQVTASTPITSSGGTTPNIAIAAATTSAAGSMSSADKTKMDGLPSSAAPSARILATGAGMTGGGDLSADRTFDVVGNADGSIVANANDIQVGVLATDSQHGDRGNGTLHTVATALTAGFMAAVDKARFDTISSSNITFKPGATSGGGVVATWAEVEAFATAATVPWILFYDTSLGAAEIPATSTQDFRGLVTIKGLSTNPTALIVKDGGYIKNITVATNGNVTCEAITRSGVVFDILGFLCILREGARISNTMGVSLVPAIDVTVANMVIAGLEAGSLVADEPTVPMVNYAFLGGFLIIAALVNSGGSASNYPDNGFIGDATSTLLEIHDTTSRLGPQPQWAGSIVYNAIARSEYLSWHSGNTASRPTQLLVGQMYFDTDLGRAIWWDGTSWVSDTDPAAIAAALHWGNASVSSTVTARYLTPGYEDDVAPIAAIQYRAPFAAAISDLYIRQNTGAGNGGDIVYTLRVNGSPSALTATVASTANDGNDVTHTATVAVGDLIDIEVTKAVDVAASPTEIVASLRVRKT